jgi:nitric oxide synthase-interacting protein
VNAFPTRPLAAKEPLVCSRGHLFCKACIYEYLLFQKSRQKQLARAADAQVADAAARVAEDEHRAEDARVAAFKNAQESLTGGRQLFAPSAATSAAPTVADGSAPPPGYKAVSTADGRTAFVLDAALIKKHTVDSAQLTEEERQQQIRVVPAFWIPAVAPEAGEKKVRAENGVLLFGDDGTRLLIRVSTMCSPQMLPV